MVEKGKIFVRSGDGRLEPLEEMPFDAEDELQELVADYPELLAGEQISPDEPRRWILIKREMGIADRPDSGDRWSVDHLLIDQDAVPTLVEAKRSSNPEIRRTIVGQMMDYAAHATRTWPVDELRRIFESRESDPEGVLRELLRTEEEPDADAFWENVTTNLAAKRIRLLFVADGIPDELARVVEFLNEQMPNIEVLAVEVKRYKGESNETLVPKVIGRLASKRNRSGSRAGNILTEEQLLNELENNDVRDAARRLLELTKRSDASISFTTRGANIRAYCPLIDRNVNVAWIISPSKPAWEKVRDFAFGAGSGIANGLAFGMELPDELDAVLTHWAGEFKNDDFAEDSSGTGVIAYSVSPENAVEYIDLLESRLRNVIDEIASLKVPAPDETLS